MYAGPQPVLLGSSVKRYIRAEGSLWRKVVDAKYETKSPNILCSQDTHPPVFWKGVMWASQTVKIGYRWQIGDGNSVKYWEDVWFGNSPLATQFWDVYFVVNQQTKTVSELWDGSQLRCTYRRTFTDSVMDQWHELVEIAKTIFFSDQSDQLIWRYETNGVYSSKSMYV
jgi:hypothetical protein